MPHKGGFEQYYDRQIVVGHNSRLIGIHPMSQRPEDVLVVFPMFKKWAVPWGSGQRTLVAVAGYFSGGNVATCEASGVVPFISSRRKEHHMPLCECLVPSVPQEGDARSKPVFGTINQTMGFRQFLTRGLKAIQSV